MKNIFLFLFGSALLFTSCTKDDKSNNQIDGTCSYSPYTQGDVLYYDTNQGVDTITVLGDSVVLGVNTKSIQYKRGQQVKVLNEYCDGTNYMNIDFDIGYPDNIDTFIYLKEGLSNGDTWTTDFQSTLNGINVRLEYVNTQKDILNSKVVNNQGFKKVIKIEQEVYATFGSQPRTLQSTNTYYYAKGTGLIETTFLDTKISIYNVQ